MIFDMEAIPETELVHFNNGQKSFFAHMVSDERNRFLLGKLEPGASIGEHTHATSSEIIYFLEGTGTAICDGIEEPVKAGVCHYCPKGSAHQMINTGDSDLIFFAVVPQQ